MSVDLHILKLFKSLIVDGVVGGLNMSEVDHGFITDFTPTPAQRKVLLEEFKPLDLRTLFSVQERESASVHDLVQKQILHYIEVYGLGMPGLFNLEQEDGKVVSITYVAGITRTELGHMVRALLYANAPTKDSIALKEIIETYQVTFDLNLVRNNEMRVLLFRLGLDKFESGDDAVRYMCLVATESALLIKSDKVISAVEAKGNLFTSSFFLDHEVPLAKVFHRHKNLILAAKTSENRGAINRISRRAKDLHVPVYEPVSKRFIAESYKGTVDPKVLQTLTLRDKFKFLNLLQYKTLGNTTDAFIIRNGKVHVEKGREVLNPFKLAAITHSVLGSVRLDLAHLKDAVVLLDEHVDYGLPSSRKQTIGQLPFGTTVTPNGDTISAGIYWENAWGARDLDLSAMSPSGHRVGWGQISGYTDRDILFSGDVTDAQNGAMEFMTSKRTLNSPYALFVNVFSGEEGPKFALVVGTKTKDHWIESPVLIEAGTLDSKGNIVGFVKNGRFVVYSVQMNDSRVAWGDKEVSIVARGLADFWTISSLLACLGIECHTTKKPDVVYDYDLSYAGFSYDKLESMLRLS